MVGGYGVFGASRGGGLGPVGGPKAGAPELDSFRENTRQVPADAPVKLEVRNLTLSYG